MSCCSVVMFSSWFRFALFSASSRADSYSSCAASSWVLPASSWVLPLETRNSPSCSWASVPLSSSWTGHIGHGGVYRLVAKACQHFLQLVALFVQLGQHFLRFGQLVAQGGGGVVQRLLQRLHTVVQRSLGLLPRSQQRRGVLQGDLRRGER